MGAARHRAVQHGRVHGCARGFDWQYDPRRVRDNTGRNQQLHDGVIDLRRAAERFTSIERTNIDMSSEVSDMAFTITFADASPPASAPSFAAAEVYGIGIEYQPTRDLR